MSEAKELNYISDLGQIVVRPWGTYQSLYEDVEGNDNYKVKRITVKPGAQLSLQSHDHRSEHWTVVRGTGTVTLDDKEVEVNPNESVYIEKKQKHRMTNKTDDTVVFIEVQCGNYVGEDDIKRYEDVYGRV